MYSIMFTMVVNTKSTLCALSTFIWVHKYLDSDTNFVIGKLVEIPRGIHVVNGLQADSSSGLCINWQLHTGF